MKQQKTKKIIPKKAVKSRDFMIAQKQKNISAIDAKRIERIIVTKFGRAIKELAKT